MKSTFGDFIAQNPNFKRFVNDEDMQSVFAFLSQDHIIIAMVDASEAHKPALAPVAASIERIFGNPNMPHIHTLDDNFTKQAVGLMVKTILDPFGYGVWMQKYLPKSAKSTKFQSASVYRRSKDKRATLRVAKYIEPVDEGEQESGSPEPLKEILDSFTQQLGEISKRVDEIKRG